MYGALDVSVSGMRANQAWMDAISANIANKNTPGYRARRVFMAPGDPGAASDAGRRSGVHVASIDQSQAQFNRRFAPDDPRAEPSGPNAGYVLESNVNVVVEQINRVQANAAYEANVAAAEATKAMIAQALRLLG